MTDQILTVLTQIEIELQVLAEPRPVLPPSPIPAPGDTTSPVTYNDWVGMTPGYKAGLGAPGPSLPDVKALLAALYSIDFVKEIGSSTLPPLIMQLKDLLVDIADKLEPLGSTNFTGGIAGLKSFLNAIQQIPGSPPELSTASDVLTQITGLLDDIPSTRNELYMIAQQLKVFADAFLNPV